MNNKLVKNNEQDTTNKISPVQKKNTVSSYEDLLIYKQYVEFIYYMTNLLAKYPKQERFALNRDIRKATYDGLECILYAYRVYDKKEKLQYLIELDIKLKLLKVFGRVSYRKEYITSKNYGAWCRKLYNIGNLLGGWINSCQKV